MYFDEKLMMQTQANGKKPHFEAKFDPLGPNLGHQFFFQTSGLLSRWISWSVIMYNIRKKLMI